MPLGQPAIPGVRTLALRDVQGAIDRIRERFTAVESQVATTTAQAGQTTLTLGQSNASISNLQRQVSALVTRLDALPTPTDRLETFIAAAAITQYDPVYVTTAGYVSPASATEINAAYGVIGVATTGAALGGNVVVRKSGTMQIAGAVFEPGGPVYVGLGGLTQFPDYVGVAVPVGVAVGTDRLDVTPGWPALQYPGVYSEFETFLPATWGLVRNAVELTTDFNSAANGIVAKTGFGDVSTRTLQQPAAGITITNPAGIAGDPTFALANDLAALEALGSTGIAVRTGADTWTQRAVAGTADRVSVTNGNGVSGGPTVDIAATYVGQTSITTLGTVATGVWQGTAVGTTFGGTAQTSWATGDLLYASGVNALAKRTIGATGDVLTVSGGVPVWAAPAASGTVTSVAASGTQGVTISGSPITSSGTITVGLGAITPTSVAASGAVSGSNLSGTNTGDQTITLTGDVTGSGTGSFATTLATVNSDVGSFGSSTAIPNFTVNAKGLVTAAGTSAVVAPAGTLTGTTLASNIVVSSLTSVGTIGTGVWQGTAVGATFGGTAQTSWATGDLLYASGANALAKRTIGTTGDVLTVSGGVPVWAAPAASGGTVTSVDITQPAAGITATGGPITSSGSITLALADDLAALEGLGSTGLAARTAANTWAQRTVTGTSARITVTNGSGAAGDPTVDIASTYVGQTSITTLGTITTGVWNGSTIGTVRGGTGFSSYTVGDILFALDATTLSKLPDVATGNALISGGVGVAPAYGKIGLTTHVTGVLPSANGGTGVANNAASTITISGAFASTFTLTGTTTVTFPTSGTLATTAQLPTGANPSANVGLTAVNGSATTFMRSDGAPALDVGISPTWSGTHTFSNAVTGASFVPTSSSVPANGMFLPGSNKLGFSVGSVEALDISALGNVHVNDSADALGLSGGRRYVVVRGTAGNVGVLALTNGSAAQGNNGIIEWYDVGNTSSSSLRNAFIFSGSAGASANNLGSFIAFATKADGVSGAGTTQLRVESTGYVRLVNDNQELQVGAGNDLRLYHNGTDSVVENDTGNLNIKSGGDLVITEGNVGIGGAPSSKLDVINGNARVIQSDFVDCNLTISQGVSTTGNTSKLNFNDSTGTTSYIYGRGSAYAAGQNYSMVFGTNSSDRLIITDLGQVALQTVGKGLSIKEGTNAKMGTATLVAGTVVVNTTVVTASSRIFLMYQSFGTITLPSSLGVSARTAGTSFTITSASVTDTSTVAWIIFEPS